MSLRKFSSLIEREPMKPKYMSTYTWAKYLVVLVLQFVLFYTASHTVCIQFHLLLHSYGKTGHDYSLHIWHPENPLVILV